MWYEMGVVGILMGAVGFAFIGGLMLFTLPEFVMGLAASLLAYLVWKFKGAGFSLGIIGVFWVWFFVGVVVAIAAGFHFPFLQPLVAVESSSYKFFNSPGIVTQFFYTGIPFVETAKSVWVGGALTILVFVMLGLAADIASIPVSFVVRRLFGLSQLPGIVCMVVMAMAPAGYGLYQVMVALHSVLLSSVWIVPIFTGLIALAGWGAGLIPLFEGSPDVSGAQMESSEGGLKASSSRGRRTRPGP